MWMTLIALLMSIISVGKDEVGVKVTRIIQTPGAQTTRRTLPRYSARWAMSPAGVVCKELPITNAQHCRAILVVPMHHM